MMGLRADMTPQVARIAATRLAGGRAAAAAVLCRAVAAGAGRQRDPDRQVPQAGIELIGADSPRPMPRAMLVAVEALGAIGLTRISLDLTLPPSGARPARRGRRAGGRAAWPGRALDRKDAAAVAEHGGALAAMLTDLLLAAGQRTRAGGARCGALTAAAVRALADRMAESHRCCTAQAPQLRLTVDPLEFRGFRYHTGHGRDGLRAGPCTRSSGVAGATSPATASRRPG